MKVCSLGNGVRVACSRCRSYGVTKRHVIKGYRGNNLFWTDDAGWSGTFDAAHGFFDSEKDAHSYCPTCVGNSEKKRKRGE